ncbi:MAG: hypothetical protein FWD73_13300 [Polyangiaceae bacterium]|nr:hypothetical protein [Polyangiaceae bacterium]
MTPRAITGLGITCALGTGAEMVFRALHAGHLAQASKAITSFDAAKYANDSSARVVEVPEFDPTTYLGSKGLRTLDRLTKLLVVAARLSLHDARIKKDNQWVALSPEGVGVCCSNAYGSLETITELDRIATLEDARYINPAKFPNTVSNSASGYVSIWEDLRAFNVTISDGNCGGLDAIACADLSLATGRAAAILTGGGEAMSEALFLAFEKLGVGGTKASPSVETIACETILGEGAAFVVLETTQGAKARSARVLGEVVGYGTSFVAPEAESVLLFTSQEAISRAIAQAIDDAGLAPKDIDIVASSISGLAQFDDEEFAAIEAVVKNVPICVPKRMFGETFGAGGTMGIVSALGWFDGAPVTALVRGAAPSRIDHVLVTTVGYYGNASAVVVRRPR